jgi:hypothetical protein
MYEKPDRNIFVCEVEGCKQSLTYAGSDLYEAFCHAREVGWFAVLNEQFCPRHAKIMAFNG